MEKTLINTCSTSTLYKINPMQCLSQKVIKKYLPVQLFERGSKQLMYGALIKISKK